MKLFSLLFAVIFLLSAVSCTPKESMLQPEEEEHTVTVTEGSYQNGTLQEITFKLLYDALDTENNQLICPVSVISAIAAGIAASEGETQTQLMEAIGAQWLSPSSVYETSLNYRNLYSSYTKGTFLSNAQMLVFENIPIREKYIALLRDRLNLPIRFESLDAETITAYYSDWLDDSSYGRIKEADWQTKEFTRPAYLDMVYAAPIWQRAQDVTRTLPVPFYYEDGTKSALSMMPVVQECGIFESNEVTAAILPMANEETRLVLLKPGKEMSLEELLILCPDHYASWLKEADWGENRVVIPKMELTQSGSMLARLEDLNADPLLSEEGSLAVMGTNLCFTDVYTCVSFALSEEGVEDADTKITYRVGVDDGIPTLTMDSEFIFLLQDCSTSVILMAGIIKDPLQK